MDKMPTDWGIRNIPVWWLLSVGAVVVFAIVLARFALRYRGPKAWVLKTNLVAFCLLLVPVAVVISTWSLIVAHMVHLGGGVSSVNLIGWALILGAVHISWQIMLAFFVFGIAAILMKDMPVEPKLTSLCVTLNAILLEGLYMYLERRPPPRF